MVDILITGGAGFIGSNLAKVSVENGYNVTVFDNLSTGNVEYLKNLPVKIVQGELNEIHDKLPPSYTPQVVFHLAASGNVIQSINDPVQNFNENVAGTISVLEYCRRAKVGKIIFSSTGGALMGNADPPVSELSIPRPISPYGASKLACEGYLNAYHNAYGLNYTIFRFGNVLGENCLHKVGVINRFFNQVRQGESLTVYGNVSRDFIYVLDLVDSMIRSINNAATDAQIFHLASGAETQIVDVAKCVLESFQRNDLTVELAGYRVGEVKRNFADVSKAQKILGLQNTLPTSKLIDLVVSYLTEATKRAND